MRAREAAAARGRDAAAAASAIHAENLQELQTLRTPEELAADAAADLHDMITRVHVQVNKLHALGPRPEP